MKIYNSVTIDIATGRILAEDSYDYDGPVAECYGGNTYSSGGGSLVNSESLALAKQFMNETSGVRQTFTQQLLEALKTGGVGARVPIIEQAVEGTRRAASKATTQTAEELARQNLAGTPYGAEIMSNSRREGDIAAENTRAGFIQQLLQMIPGYLTGTAQTAVAGASATTGKSTTSWGAQGGLNCCFIFIASHGYLHPIVRRYRDTHMTVRNRRGYYWLSDRLVPWMAKYPLARHLVSWLMVKPMTSYGKYYYGLNRYGWLFAGLTKGWLLIYSLLGLRPPYTRRGTKEVV